MAEILIAVTRGQEIESKHHGHVVVVNSAGKVLAYAGDPYTKTFFRSSAKPIQAMNLILSGAADAFSMTQKELAIACASHYGESFHRVVLEALLVKMGLTKEALLCGSPFSIKMEHTIQLLKEGHCFDQLNSDCSGKHCGFLAACLIKGYSLTDYDKQDHPLQSDLLDILSYMCEMERADIGIAKDGCGVPVHFMPIYNMALSYAKLANSINISNDYKIASERICGAMNAAPDMVAGTGGFCTNLIKNTNNKFVAKLGAESVYCIGVKDKDIGITIKIEDGNYSRALFPAVMSVLMQLDLLTGKEYLSLQEFARPKNINCHGVMVGEVIPVFTLKTLCAATKN